MVTGAPIERHSGAVFSPNGSQVYGLNVGGPAFHVKKRQLETT